MEIFFQKMLNRRTLKQDYSLLEQLNMEKLKYLQLNNINEANLITVLFCCFLEPLRSRFIRNYSH